MATRIVKIWEGNKIPASGKLITERTYHFAGMSGPGLLAAYYEISEEDYQAMEKEKAESEAARAKLPWYKRWFN